MANNPSSTKYHSRQHFSVRFGTNKLGLAAACGRWENLRAPSVTQYHNISFAHLSILRGHDLAEVSAPSYNTIALDKSGSGASAGVSPAGETSPTPAPTWFPPWSGLTRFETFSCRSRGTGSMGLCFKPCGSYGSSGIREDIFDPALKYAGVLGFPAHSNSPRPTQLLRLPHRQCLQWRIFHARYIYIGLQLVS